uniref:Uncharacterized protein n=1 Tax=Anguilla anguilla TaxID=7936 RepID=A0A0E9XRI7_ANGAN
MCKLVVRIYANEKHCVTCHLKKAEPIKQDLFYGEVPSSSKENLDTAKLKYPPYQPLYWPLSERAFCHSLDFASNSKATSCLRKSYSAIETILRRHHSVQL